MHHDLKTVQPFFSRVDSGEKTFEFRFNDRDFQTGDTACLREYDPKTDTYPGSTIFVNITYVLKEFKGIEAGYCIFGFIKQ